MKPTPQMPSTLPAMSCEGLTEESRSSYTRLPFSSIVLFTRIWLMPTMPMKRKIMNAKGAIASA